MGEMGPSPGIQGSCFLDTHHHRTGWGKSKFTVVHIQQLINDTRISCFEYSLLETYFCPTLCSVHSGPVVSRPGAPSAWGWLWGRGETGTGNGEGGGLDKLMVE